MAILEVVNVTKQFGGLTAVSELNISVDEQMIYSVIGPKDRKSVV